MVLNNLNYNHLTPLGLKGLKVKANVRNICNVQKKSDAKDTHDCNYDVVLSDVTQMIAISFIQRSETVTGPFSFTQCNLTHQLLDAM